MSPRQVVDAVDEMAAGAVAAEDILTGRGTFEATTPATALVTVPAGRTWAGVVGASVSVGIAAGSSTPGRAGAVFSVAGAGAAPAGDVFGMDAKAGANAATGTVGGSAANFGSAPLVVVAPAENDVTISVATTNAGTASLVDAFATGRLV